MKVVFALLLACGGVFAQGLDPLDCLRDELVLSVTSGAEIQSTVLDAGANYYLRVSGVYGYANGNPWMDAAFCYQGPVQGCSPARPDTGGLDADWFWNGLRNQRPTPDVYNPNHIYYFHFVGDGQAQSFYFYEPNSWDYWDNVGALNIQVWQESCIDPPPPSDECPGGSALQFDGVNDYVRIADAFFDGQETNSFTVECWFQTANDNQQYGSFIWNKTAFWQEAYLSYCCDRSFSFLYAYPFAYNNAYVEHFPLQTGQWHHIAASMENSTLRLFLDGQMIASSATNGLMSWATDVGTNRIGSGIVSGNSYYFDGAVDEMRFSSVARYVADFSVPTEPFVNDQYTEALYHFDEGIGNTLTDASGNNHHGTLIDNPQWICSDAQLPVELLSFTATPSNSRVTLNWSTGSESNVSHFEIDRDGGSMAHVAATNNASGHTYTWPDEVVNNGQTYSYTLTSVDLDGSRTVLGTVEATPQAEMIPSEFMLSQNYPNPFNASTTIEYSLPEATDISLKLFNLAGQEVAVLASGAHAAGRHVVSLNASELSSGIYFYRLESPMRSIQQKMVLLK